MMSSCVNACIMMEWMKGEKMLSISPAESPSINSPLDNGGTVNRTPSSITNALLRAERRTYHRQQRQSDQMRRMAKIRRHFDKHAHDTALLASLSKKPLNNIILEYKFLHVTPPFWTHRHEKLLHVAWQPFQPPPSPRLPSPQCSRHSHRRRQQQQRRLKQQLRLQQSKQATPRKLPRIVERRPQRRLVRNLYRPLPTPSQLQQLLLPLPPLYFKLTVEDQSLITYHICHIESGEFKSTYSIQRAMQALLSGVDEHPWFKILNPITPSRDFLRLREENLCIFYGQKRYYFFMGTPVYRLDTQGNNENVNNNEVSCGDLRGPTQRNSIGTFWRMIHLDSTHVSLSIPITRKYGRNFRRYGIRDTGMSMDECTVRYDYEHGDENWSHPHFVPGVFISMEQRYRRNEWNGQKGREKGVQADWQILFTDSPNDRVYAHLYTTRVPAFLVACFDEPTQWHSPVPSASEESNGASERKERNKHGDVPFEFAIRHTRIAYKPYESFRERLRQAIVYSLGSFGDANKNTS
ncbi:hypothetical protein F5Y12DRAFT_664056 [Xylaria sp. FL1777]|nr:hypothetical protein F5Y12DRAFT_664056 [Xylaria sp. FL1777]